MSTEPVLILKKDKVVCFEPLLQVLILKGLWETLEDSHRADGRRSGVDSSQFVVEARN